MSVEVSRSQVNTFVEALEKTRLTHPEITFFRVIKNPDNAIEIRVGSNLAGIYPHIIFRAVFADGKLHNTYVSSFTSPNTAFQLGVNLAQAILSKEK